LRKHIRRDEPQRLLDLLLCGALIEARSCERFMGLAPLLESPLKDFYQGLAASETRHHGLYLKLAQSRYPQQWQGRLAELAEVESELITTPDPKFRFHSGAPAA